MPIFLQKVIQISQCLLDRYTKTIIIYQEYQNPFPIGSLQSTQTLDRKPTQPTVHTHTNQKKQNGQVPHPKKWETWVSRRNWSPWCARLWAPSRNTSRSSTRSRTARTRRGAWGCAWPWTRPSRTSARSPTCPSSSSGFLYDQGWFAPKASARRVRLSIFMPARLV